MTRVRSLLMVMLAFALGAAFVSQAQAQGSGGRSRGSLLGLLGIEQVQKELKLNDEAVAKVEKLREKIRGEMTEQYSAAREIEDREKLAKTNKGAQAKRSELFSGMRDASDEQRREAFEDMKGKKIELPSRGGR